MNTNKIVHAALLAAVATLATTSANALSISATPASQTASPGTVTVDLVMSFESQSIGGGIILDFSGPLSFVSFTPSAYFNSLNTTADDTDFTGFGTSNKPASAEYEIHFGSFSGISGNNTLGTLTFNYAGGGTGLIDLSISPELNYGGFLDLSAQPLAVTLNDATVNPVPLPAAAWLFGTGLGIAGIWRRRRSA